MTVSPTNGSAQQAPKNEPKQAPKIEPKKPQDNTAATQAPGQTRSAVSNTFGKVPDNAAKNTGAKAQGSNARPPVRLKQTTPDDPKTAPATNTTSPVDPRVQGILDTQLPDGKSVKEKLDADAPNYIIKAAQDHYNKQKEVGEQPDAVSRFYLNNVARDMVKNGVKDERVSPEKLAEVFDAKQIDKNIEELTRDPAFIQWSAEQQANSVQNTIDKNPDIAKLIAPYLQEGENHVNALRRMQSDYLTSQEFADGAARDDKDVITEGMKTLSSLGLGEKEMLGVGNTLAENIRSKYTPDAPRPVIDPNTNKPIQTEDGNDLAILPDGTNIALDKDGKAVADKQGNAYVYYQDGSTKLDANGKYIQYDARAKTIYADYGGTKYMLGPDRKGRYDAQGRPLGIDSGAAVVLGKDGKAVTDKAGNKLVFDSATGKAVTDPASGNAVVIDPATRGIVQTDINGKVVSAANGDPYAVDQKTGKFVQDAQGRYVQISKDNIAPGILPGYVVDANNSKVVVSPIDGKPMVDPSTGKTVILDPKTNAPQLVPLDANGAPKLAQDGKSIVYNETGTTVVPGKGRQPDWLVNQNGRYVRNTAGNYIGVDRKTGLAAPVDEKGFVKDGNGLAPLWDPETGAPMKTTDGMQIAIDRRGTMLMLNEQGQFIFEEKSGLPYVVDPKTRSSVTNPDTGRSILLSKGGALVEYNADDGVQYLIDPKTRTTVKTGDGIPVVMSDKAGVPYAVNPDGSPVRNPATGNTIVYGLDGQPAKEVSTGHRLEITANGKAHVIDPKTNMPMAQKDPKTGAYRMLNKDGSDVTNPDTGNKVQLTPGSALRVEIDAATNKPVEDGKGNILLLGPDNRPLKTPDGNAVVADNKSGVPVAVDAEGKVIAEPVSGLPRVANTDTGMPVTDPKTGAAVVIDPQSGQPVQIDPKTGTPIKDTATDLAIIANGRTGAQLHGPNGEPVVMAPALGMPGYADAATNTFTAFDLATGKTMTNPVTCATVILDPDLGIPAEVLPDKAGNLVLVDGNGKGRTDGKGNALLLDKDTGQVVVKDAGGNLVDADTGKKPEKVTMKVVAHSLPLLQVPYIAYNTTGKGNTPAGDQAEPPIEQTDTPAAPPNPFDVRTTPEDRAAMKASWNVIDDWGDFLPIRDRDNPYQYYEKKARAAQAADPRLASIPVEDLAALSRYTACSLGINDALRSGDPARIAAYEASIKSVRSALNQLSNLGFSYQGELFRSISQNVTQISENWQIGAKVTDPGFVSTSSAPEISNEFGNLRLKLKGAAAVDISSVSMFPWQKEFLIMDGSEWHITDGGTYESFAIDDIDQYPQEFRELEPVTLLDRQPVASTSAIPGALDNTSSDVPASGRPFDTESTTTASSDPLLPYNSAEAAARTSRWAKLGATVGRVLDGLDIAGGGAQVVLGGLQIADGVKYNDKIEIASGSLNTVSGALGLSAGVTGLIGGAAAAAAVPLAAASFIVGGIAGIVDFVGSLDDDEQFADKVGNDFGPLGILSENWRQKAQDAYKDGYEKTMGPNHQA